MQRYVRHQEHRFDAVVELAVHSGQLILIFEIGHAPDTADNGGRAQRIGEIHQQRVEADDADAGIADRCNLSFDHRDPFVVRKHRRFCRVGRDTDDQFVDELCPAPDDVHMAQRDGIECPGVYANPVRHQRSLSVM